jgi:2-polyprenyl-6-methoxyphenol hydroxylase-like FAD-dependent oxidoreductase
MNTHLGVPSLAGDPVLLAASTDGRRTGRHAVIVGGGLGGVTAAVGLAHIGWEVTLLERAPEFGEVGAGITLLANALAALDRIGLGAEIGSEGSWDVPGGIRTRSGRWIARMSARDLGDRTTAGSLGIHRARLHALIRAHLDPATLVPGADVVDIRDREVRYLSGGREHTVTADLVVGADGLRSRVRQYVAATAPPRYLGSTAWRGVTSERWPAQEPVAITWHRGQEFGVVPLADGRMYWFASECAPEGALNPREKDYLLSRYSNWHAPIPDLIRATADKEVIRHDLYELAAPLPSYVRGSVALLGDAAHAMAPTLGQGACQAIEDAVVLAICLEPADEPLSAALDRYDRLRRPRTQSMARTARMMARFGQQLSNPVAVAVRNGAMAMVPPWLAVRSIARHVDWRPPQPQHAEPT